jgi:hypothetical protein
MQRKNGCVNTILFCFDENIFCRVMRHGQEDMDQLSSEVVMKLCEDIQKEDAEGVTKADE